MTLPRGLRGSLTAAARLPQGQYKEKLASMGADGFMLSRMEAEDLEDVVPDKAHRLKIVEAAKEAMISNPTAKSGARQDYGRVLGHDRDD